MQTLDKYQWTSKEHKRDWTIVLHSQIHEYGHVRNGWNGRRMLITIEHMNLDVRRRDTILLCCLIHLAPIGRTFASHLRAPKVDPSRWRLVPNSLSSNSHTNLCALPVRDVTRTLSPRFVSDYYDIWVTPLSARARALTPASMLHLTNPSAEPKGSQPN